MDVSLVNADFARRTVIDAGRAPWIASPEPGVERRPLDRIGGEVARATSIVRYAPGSTFAAHVHPLGEEFLVLERVFSDELGDYPAGTYVRNPPGSAHAPGSRTGCMIFVKLRQMPENENARVVIDTRRGTWTQGEVDGHARQLLHAPAATPERVALERLDSGARLPQMDLTGGEEILVLSGILTDDEGSYGALTWIRNPPGYRRSLRSAAGAVYWSKRGHL